MRQAGILAAAGLVAFEDGIARLAEDHENARCLAQGLKEIKNLMIINDPPETNMVMVKFSPSPVPPEKIINALQAQNIRISL